jgi:hypothetical protein
MADKRCDMRWVEDLRGGRNDNVRRVGEAMVRIWRMSLSLDEDGEDDGQERERCKVFERRAGVTRTARSCDREDGVETHMEKKRYGRARDERWEFVSESARYASRPKSSSTQQANLTM